MPLRLLSETAIVPAPLDVEPGYSTVMPPFPWSATRGGDLVLGIEVETWHYMDVHDPGIGFLAGSYHGILMQAVTSDGHTPRKYEVHYCPCHARSALVQAALTGVITGTGE